MNKGFKTLCTLMLCITLIFQVLSGTILGKQTEKNGQYSDLHGHWAEKIIRDMISEGYIKGELVNGELVINPDRPITRAEFVVVLTKAKNYKKTSDSAKSFSDLKENSWYSEAVEIATSNGIINGYPDGTFKPNNPITRAEASAIISNSNNLNQEDNLKKLDNVKEFNDISKNHWYYNSVMLCRLFDIISGYPDGSFRPGNNITRAEAFVMIYKSIKQKDAEDGKLDDVPDDPNDPADPAGSDDSQPSTPGSKGAGSKPGGNASQDEKVDVHLTGFSIFDDEVLIAVGEEYTLLTIFEPFAATNKKVFWHSENPEILTVNSEGKIKGISEGTTTVFARTEDGNFEDSCIVTVETNEIIIENIDTDKLPMIDVNETIVVSVSAKSKTNSKLQYYCEAEAGTVDASMSENIYLISWTAPDDKGKYHLNIKITDDRGKSIERKLPIWVGIYFDTIDFNENLPPYEDLDGDGLTNAEELALGTSPRNPDSDGDGLSDYEEIYIYKTNPQISDSDGDDIVDGAEILLNTNPLVPDEQEFFDIKISDKNIEVNILGSGNNVLSTVTECDNRLFNSYKGLIGIPYKLKTPESLESLEVSIKYDKTEVEEKRADESRLTIYRYRYEKGIVEEMNDVHVDTKNKRVSGKISPFPSGETIFFVGTKELSDAQIGNFDIVFALDMSENMKAVDEDCTWKEPLLTLVGIMGEGSRMSVVQSAYNPPDNIEVVEEMTFDKDIIRYGITDLMYKVSPGKSNLAGMFEKAFDVLSEDAGNNGRMVVAVLSTCTDEEYKLLESKIKEAAVNNIVVHIITITGDAAQRDKMKELAEIAHGRFVYIPAPGLSRFAVSDLAGDFRQLVNARKIVSSDDFLVASAFNYSVNSTVNTNNKIQVSEILLQDFDIGKHTYSFSNKANNIYTESAHCAGMAITVVMNYIDLLPSAVKLTDREKKLDEKKEKIDFSSVKDDDYVYNLFSDDFQYKNIQNKDIYSLTETKNVNKMIDYWWFRLNFELDSYDWAYNESSSAFIDNYLETDFITGMCKLIEEDYPVLIGIGNTYKTKKEDKDGKKRKVNANSFHALVAYGVQKTYDDSELCKVEFYIYDCNYPGDGDRRLVCTRNKNNKGKYKDEWKYSYPLSEYHNMYYTSDEKYAGDKVRYRAFDFYNMDEYIKFITDYFTDDNKSNATFKENPNYTEISITLPNEKVEAYKLYDVFPDAIVEADKSSITKIRNNAGNLTKLNLKSRKHYNNLVVGIDTRFVERQIRNDKGKKVTVNIPDVYPDVFQSPYSGFPDLKSYNWFTDDVLKLKAKGVVSGYPDGNFYPYNSVTRAELIVIVMHAFQIYQNTQADKHKAETYRNKYPDLKEHWARDTCGLALAEGWVKPGSETAFKPDEKITREEAASILWNIMSSDRAKNVTSLIKNDTSTTTYADNELIREDYRFAAAHLQINKIMTGYANKYFEPRSYITRAETCKIVCNALIQ